MTLKEENATLLETTRRLKEENLSLLMIPRTLANWEDFKGYDDVVWMRPFFTFNPSDIVPIIVYLHALKREFESF